MKVVQDEQFEKKLDQILISVEEHEDVKDVHDQFHYHFDRLFDALPGPYRHCLLQMEALFNYMLVVSGREAYIKGLQEGASLLNPHEEVLA